MARNEQLIRQHRLLQLLERYRYGRTIQEIRDELVEEMGLTSLHIRSVRRDLQALQAGGVDVKTEKLGRGIVWKLGTRSRAQQVSVSATELIALSLGRDLLYPLAGTPFWTGIETFWHKIQDQLPETVQKHYRQYRQTMFVRGTPAKSYERQHGILSTIHRAIQQHRVVEIRYQPIGKDASTRQIEPYAVVFYQSSLYIIAAAAEQTDPEQRIRHWKLDRFLKSKILDTWFTPDPEFDLAKHMGRSLGIFAGRRPMNFRIQISARAAPWVLEDPWQPDQVVERQADGSIVLSVTAAHELEIIPRVLALGGEAELLSPKSSRQAIAAAINQLAERYRDSS